MSPESRYCPDCQTALPPSRPLPPGAQVRCPRCGALFDAGPPREATVMPEPEGPMEQPIGKPWRPILLGALGGGTVAAAVLLLVVFFLSGRNRQPHTVKVHPPPGGPVNPPPGPVAHPPAKPASKILAAPQVAKATSNPGPAQPPAPPGESGDSSSLPVTAKERPWLVLDAGGHTASVSQVLFTPDARRVLSVSADRTVRLWDVGTGEAVHTFRLPIGPGSEGALLAAALSPDGRRLAVAGMPCGAGRDGVPIHILDLETRQVAKVIREHTDLIHGLAFSPDAGKYLASASGDRLGAVYDVATGKPVCLCKGHTEGVRQVAWHPQGRLLATASFDGSARLWEIPSGRPLAVLPGGDSKILAVAWSPDGDTLATGTLHGSVALWGRDGTPRRTYTLPGARGGPINVTSLAFTPHGRELLYTGVDSTGRAGLLDVATGQVRLTFDRHNNAVKHGSLSRDGALAVTAGGNDNEIFVWRAADGSVVRQFKGLGRSVWGAGWSHDGRTLCWGNVNRGSTTAANMPLQHAFRPDRLEVSPLPTGNYIRTAREANGYTLHAADLFRVEVKRRGKTVHTLRSPLKGDRIYCYTLVPGERAVLGTSFGLFLMDLQTGGVIRRLRGHNGHVLAAAPSPDGRYLLTGGWDQKLCLWDLFTDDEPMLTLFAAGREWIAWTPQGYYACSPLGERLMGWQVNRGPDKLGAFYPAAQFRKSLYRPDVIRSVLSAGGLDKALAQAGLGPKGSAVNVAEALPPRVVLASPGPGRLPTGRTAVVVQAVARPAGPHPVTAMRLLIDGRPFEGTRGIRVFNDASLGERLAAWSVELAPGKHTLAVQAESPLSKGLSQVVEVERGAEGKPPPPGNLYVLAIGISAYEGKLRLQYAHKDAVAIERLFREKAAGLFTRVETRLLTDKDATRKNILEGLSWLGKVMTPNDVAVLFFAGHGTRDAAGNFHLVPLDVDPKDIAGTSISGEFLKKALADMPGRLVALFDACHSGASALGSVPGKASTDELARELASEDYGVVVMCSSMGHELSGESDATGHGLFTVGLLEGLSGKADYNKDRLVHINEIDVYAFVRVRELSAGRKTPLTARPATVRPFALTRY